MKNKNWKQKIRFVLSFLLIGGVLFSFSPTTRALVGRSLGSLGGGGAGHNFRQPGAVTNGLVGWWNFDGNANDSSGSGNNGTVTGATLTDGKFGKAYSFNGTSDYIQKTSASNLPILAENSFSYSIWVYPRTIANDKTVFVFGDNWGSATIGSKRGLTLLGTTGYIYFYGHSQNGNEPPDKNSSTAVDLNKWNQITVSYNATTDLLTIYKNGTSIATETISNFTNGGSNVQFGGPTGFGWQNYFDGLIDDVRIYNRTLTQAEITELYTGSKPSNCDQTCVGYWKLDDSAGNTTVTDALARTGNKGTAQQNTSALSGAGKYGTALTFNGTSDYIDIGSNNIIGTGTSPVTISFWMYPTQTLTEGQYYMPIRLNQTTELFISFYISSGEFGIYSTFRGSTQWRKPITQSSITNGWHHFMAVYNGGDKSTASSFTYYIDGTSVGSGTTNLGTAGGTANANVIGVDSPAGGYFKGSLDDVRVYNTALSATDASNIYSSSVPYATNSNLVGYWKMDDNAANTAVKDYSAGNFGISQANTNTKTTDGIFGPGMTFNGTSDWVDASDSNLLSGNTARSTSFWTKTSATGEKYFLSYGTASSNQQWAIGVYNSHLVFTQNGANAQSTNNPSDGNWHFIAVTWDSSVIGLYIDGSRETLSFNNLPGSFNTVLGGILYIGRGTSAGYNISASIDDVRIYNRALQPYEVYEMYQAGKPAH